MGMTGLDFQHWTWGMLSCLFELLPPFAIWRSKQFYLCGRWRSLGGAKEERCWLQRRAHESSSAGKRSPVSMGVSLPYLQNKLIAVLRVGHRFFKNSNIRVSSLLSSNPGF